jgi:hypothetical protein
MKNNISQRRKEMSENKRADNILVSLLSLDLDFNTSTPLSTVGGREDITVWK